jgi:glycogen operon protein
LPEPLGVTLDDDGVNVAVYSASASSIDFCLFEDENESRRFRLPARTGNMFHGAIGGISAGARYGLRAHGPFAPAQGLRFDASKLLVDPFATTLDRKLRLHPSMLVRGADSAPYTARAIVAPLAGLTPAEPFIPWDRMVIYELHVRGFTMRHPEIPPELRGTFAALAYPAVIAHLQRLGVTTVELMPCAAWIEEPHLAVRGLSNYWGYNPIAWMAPDPALAPGGWVEVRAAIAALAAAGMETVLDVVLNHSGEGDDKGPTLSLRGLDNSTYYRLGEDGNYVDDSGCGNTLALDHPPALRLAMDALRVWAGAGLHGFRFDLATTLGRRADGFDPAAPLLAAVVQDPVLRRLKLIAEPWDIGDGGYRMGSFPARWGEWNDRFRDSIRRFWRGDKSARGELATRLAGSSDLFAPRRPPSRSINYVVAHDGFTLADLVGFTTRHNEANGEANRDGTEANFSWNNGVEGPSTDPAIRAARLRDQRALLATLLVARGTPMIAMGAEIGHSQRGNNNAYAQDNEIAWLNWNDADPTLIGFAAKLAAIRRSHPVLRADRWLTGDPQPGTLLPDVEWRRADGAVMTPQHWSADGNTLVACLSEGNDRVVLVFHRGHAPVEITLPPAREGTSWQVLADSAREGEDDAPEDPLPDDAVTCTGRAVLVLVETPSSRRHPPDLALLNRLAKAAGIASEWWDIDGTAHQVSPDTKRALLAAMQFPARSDAQVRESLSRLTDERDRRPLPHALVLREGEASVLTLGPAQTLPVWLTLESEDGEVRDMRTEAASEVTLMGADGVPVPGWRVTLPTLPCGRWRVRRDDLPDIKCGLVVVPARCYLPLAESERRFGLAAHLYSLRREGDQGIGDFTALARLAEAAGRRGAATIGLNPLHALFPAERERASPYHPSDRRFLDPIYLDAGQPTDDGPMVDYTRVWARKRAALMDAFAAAPPDPGFDTFVAAGGPELVRFATFQAIAETRPGEPWMRWPEELRTATHPGVATFAAAHVESVRFHLWLQWRCDVELDAASRRARDAGVSLGFYRDLAVGCAPDGAEAWAGADELAFGVSVGAPPDPFSTSGQIWHLPPPDPLRMARRGYARFGRLLAANMRHAGALRIDHVMAFTRLFWIPEGGSGADGSYVSYPLSDLLGQLALESARAQCLVVGEDLGTVPEGLREALAAADVLSYRVLWFERDGPRFRPPASYPARAVACVSTHDLPTLAGWVSGADLEERAALHLLHSPEQATAERAAEKSALKEALKEAGLGAEPTPQALHTFIASTPCQLVLAQADDLAGETMAINLPGTDRERPNWRRRIATPVETLLDTEPAASILAAIAAGRRP